MAHTGKLQNSAERCGQREHGRTDNVRLRRRPRSAALRGQAAHVKKVDAVGPPLGLVAEVDGKSEREKE